jgi:ATP-dependent Zn protease
MGESYSGAVDDLHRVQLICKQMVAEFGMGVALTHDGPAPIAIPTGDYAVSDATRREVDVAAMTLSRDAFRRARALLAANRECLDHLAATALERETLTREELDEVFAAHELHVLADRHGSGGAMVAMTRPPRDG